MALTDTLENKANSILDANAPGFGSANQINAASLSSTPTLREAPAAIPTDFTSFVNSLTPDTSALTQSGDKLRSEISDTLTDFEGKGARQAEIEGDLGLPEDRQRLRELNLQIAQLKGEFDKAIVNEEGAVRPQEFITGRQDFLQKKSAVMVGALTSVAQALQGNITLAEQTADRTIEREFADEEARLARLQFEYTENKDALERADKKGADQLALYVQERARVLQDQKEERKGVLALAQTAAVNGAPNSVVNRIVQSGSQEQAMSLASGWLAKSGEGVSDQLYAGLTPQTATAVRTLVGKYGSEPTVQNFATIQEGYQFVQALSSSTTNPADDQALIYSLAKILDPGSVVREGEYATAQKYAQSWINAYGKSISQAINGTGFLSEAARENIKKTIESRYKASLNSYQNLQQQYARRIDSLTGRESGADFLVDYNTATPPADDQAANDQATAILDSILKTPAAESRGFFGKFLNVFGL